MATVPNFEEVHFSLIVILLLFELKNHEGAEENVAKLPKDANYVWKESEWSDCYFPLGCGNGEKKRIVWCEDEKGYKSPQTYCDSEMKPSENESCFKSCGRHKHSVRWRTSKWGMCFNNDSVGQCTERWGIMKRTVICVQTKKMIGVKQKPLEEEACSMLLPKPSMQKSCLVRCPQNCIVSDFGKWSRCDDCSSPSEIRTRRILVAPTREGKPCPPLVDSRKCTYTTECLRSSSPVYEFSIKLEKWGPCIPSNSTRNTSRHPIVGYRIRNITCVNGLGEIVHTSWCTTGSVLPVPTVESCIISIDCQLTDWSQWSLLSEGCVTSTGRTYPEIRARYRKISSLSEGDGAPCSHLTEKRFVSESLPMCSSRYKWIHSEWGNCYHYGGSCGSGLQRRKLICLRVKDRIPVEEVFCKEIKPSEVKQCNTACEMKCLVSPWSSWGQCKPFSTQLPEMEFMGYRQRERQIIQSSSGEDCAELVEVDSCQEPVVVTWIVGNWSDCLLIDITQPCGEGIRRRNTSCITATGIQEPSLCDTLPTLPKQMAPCYISCPRDCIISEWTEWSTCTATCTSSNGSGVRTRKRKVIAEAGPGGKPCPAPDHLFETESCRHKSCFGYHWDKSEWSLCRPIQNKTCGKGVQMRQVTCVHGNEIIVSDKKCAPIMKPANERACNVTCPVDCITTNFTEWTPCPLNCVPGATQQRVKYILRSSSWGGTLCPENLKETRPCVFKEDLNCLKKLNTTITDINYRWEIAAWSECTLTQGLQCGDGYQTRKVSCIREDGKEVLPHYCLSTQNGKLLTSSRRCHVFCNQRCALSEWSSWSGDERIACPATVTRTREATGTICARETLVETKPIPSIPILSNSEGHWSECIVNRNNKEVIITNGMMIRGRCGAGWRYIKGNHIDGCKQTGLLKDMCLEDCPESCQMSAWSEWSSCNVTCGQGYRHRQRDIVKYGNKLGRRCLPTSGAIELQEIVCDEPCDQYRWATGEWDDCEIIQSATSSCGKGKQRRSVSCNKFSKDDTFQEVDETFCDPFDKPDAEIDCNIPCPDDCIVSVWNSWTKCVEPCDNSQSRKRNRVVLRIPSTEINCPILLEEEPCVLGLNCFHHKWIIGDWSSCVLPKGAICGRGMSTRAISCVRSTGRYVDHKYCQKPDIIPLTKTCNVECPVDCEVSEWTDWSYEECKPCINNGKRRRIRHVLQQPSDSGLPCPLEVVQEIPCPFQPCYHWNITKWSSCNLEGASCGHGYRTRNVNCKRYDGIEVNKEKCLKINMTEGVGGWLDTRWLELAYSVQEIEACYQPCPGDCVFTTWSKWSLCHRDCSSGHIVGYQTRSRAVIQQSKSLEKCPYNLWETKPCWGGPCLSYNWKLKDGAIQCIRSDGIVAHGGCNDLPRPCYPTCNSKQSRCDYVLGECICLDGFSPVYNKSDATPKAINCIESSLVNLAIAKNLTPTREEIVLRYYPDDNEFSFWMYAMICVGSAFVIFVVVTIYLMCSHNPTLRGNDERRTVRMKSYAAR